MMRQVLVTGAAGLLGVCLLTELRRSGAEVLAVDDGSAGTWHRLARFDADPGVITHRVDICDRRALAAVWPRDGVDAVVHLAARHFIPDCQANPEKTWQTNVVGTSNVLSVAAERRATRFVLASTADVYEASVDPHHEGSALGPTSVYGRTKQLDEVMLRHAAALGATTEYLAVRLFNLYGPEPTVDHLIPAITAQALAGGPLLLGNLDSQRDYVFVADAAAAVAELLHAPITGVVNVGTGIGTTGHSVVEHAGSSLGRELVVTSDPRRMRPSDRTHLVSDPARLVQHVPWWPATSVRDGIEAVVAAGSGA
ncbi:NAD-dependent epimerase/dehydratase family protein [Kitasatospora sp. HPMI-4]|uniref:NAD-dependent epimerase/dehydratase family protein n=1 Tax=Kitasatospora sp. HPMI-4 TaxID=3448443 RepID=UPI003F194790